MPEVCHHDPVLDLLVVGGLNHDITVHVDRRPSGGETVVGGGPRFDSGGKGANQAVAAALTGASVMLCAAVGNDPIGRHEIDILRHAGVALDAIKVDPSSPTGTALIIVTPDGENSIAVGAGANRLLDADHIAAAIRTTPSAVVLAQSEPGPQAVEAAARACASSRTRFVLNAAPVADAPRDALALADPLIVNEHEAREIIGALDGSSAEAIAHDLLRVTGARSVVVSFGSGGAIVGNGSSMTHVAAQPINPVDTTGSGDVLAGVVAANLALGLDLVDAVGEGCRLASMAATRPGARSLQSFSAAELQLRPAQDYRA